MNPTFEGDQCPWNPDCGDGTIIIGHHPDSKPRRVPVLPGAGHPMICYVKFECARIEREKGASSK